MPVEIPLQGGAIVQLTYRSLLAGQRILNTFRYRCVTDLTTLPDYRLALADLADQLDAAAGMTFKYVSACPTNMVIQKYRLQPIWPIRQRYEEYDVGQNGLATLGSTNTANVAVSIKRTGDIIGPHGVGRVQIPACTTGVTAGLVDPAYITADLVPLADQMKLEIPGVVYPITWVPLLFSVTNNIVSSADIIATSVEDTARVMRRRTVRVGE